MSENLNDWMQRHGQKHQKYSQNRDFLTFVTPKIFFGPYHFFTLMVHYVHAKD